jgi:hypothetical protein
VLVEAAGQQDHPLGPFGHLGVACASREEIDRLYAEACREGRPTRAPIDAGDPVGYTARIADPDGHSLELSLVRRSGSPCGRRRKDELGRSGSSILGLKPRRGDEWRCPRLACTGPRTKQYQHLRRVNPAERSCSLT